ncbi:interferon-induced gtp-binding protein mx [Diplodia corticola]|uniref:Interferon-induced gtp-binding protein mx n=1 Tax=Diplodia corticola TaxID=236234 RepID=A0A1J9QN39_9PEZI|nr:interferon-induced gtp-binding protein mx [Diplodia corticola]OJD29482.1 interferon-induced gtp-binding protein mx [Diplodia corticola]
MSAYGTPTLGPVADTPPYSPETLATYLNEVKLDEPDVEMKTVSLEDTALGQLQNGDQANLLDVIDELRGHGISKHIDLPQLIVCGDQSSGKSSLLEAITHLPFPSKDGICTTFATEVALRRSPRRSIKISIIPGPSRSDADKDRLKRFTATFTNPSDFPALIEDAKKCMNGTSSPSPDSPTTPPANKSINDDVLHLDISGPSWPPLTIVDLPGLIHTQARGQTAADVRTVRRLTQSYASNPRSVILAVVAANYDHANQAVLGLAREADPSGRRTLGIVTKPDRVVVGGEDERGVVRLVKNAEHELRLGWHVVKNRDHAMRDASSDERDRAERDFFANGVWASVVKAHVGVDALRARLGAILLRQIRTELPVLQEEIRKGVRECEEGLARMGEPRESARDQRAYLVEISKTFERLTLDAVRGTYRNEFFTLPTEEEAQPRRLRAVVQNANEEFAFVMQKYGHSSTIVNSATEAEPSYKRVSSSHNGASGCWSPLENSAPAPRITLRSDFIEEIKEKERSRRGCELPGMYNPLLVCDIFREQARPWEVIVKEHADIIWHAALGFLETLLGSLTEGHTNYALLEDHIQPIMDAKRKELFTKIEELLRPYKSEHLITYHPLFRESMQQLRSKKLQSDVSSRLGRWYGADMSAAIQTSPEKIVNALNITSGGHGDVDEGESASEELLYCMEAFYKVALHTFIDNAATLAVESCLVSSLPDIFSPGVVSAMDDETLANLASESEETRRERSTLQERLRNLKEGARIVGRHARQAPPPPPQEAPRKPAARTTRRTPHAPATPQPTPQPTPARKSAPFPTCESESSSSTSSPVMPASVPSDATLAVPTPPTSSPEGHREADPKLGLSENTRNQPPPPPRRKWSPENFSGPGGPDWHSILGEIDDYCNGVRAPAMTSSAGVPRVSVEDDEEL